MAGRVKVLVGERKHNKTKITDLEAEVQHLNDRLYQAERKTAVTATVGKRETNGLK